MEEQDLNRQERWVRVYAEAAIATGVDFNSDFVSPSSDEVRENFYLNHSMISIQVLERKHIKERRKIRKNILWAIHIN